MRGALEPLRVPGPSCVGDLHASMAPVFPKRRDGLRFLETGVLDAASVAFPGLGFCQLQRSHRKAGLAAVRAGKTCGVAMVMRSLNCSHTSAYYGLTLDIESGVLISRPASLRTAHK